MDKGIVVEQGTHEDLDFVDDGFRGGHGPHAKHTHNAVIRGAAEEPEHLCRAGAEVRAPGMTLSYRP